MFQEADMSVEFIAIVVMVILIPGVDQLMVLRNTLVRGRIAGIATALGIGLASAIQAALVSIGIGAVIVAVQPMFEVIRWLGVTYLLWLGIGALRSAISGTYAQEEGRKADGALFGFRDGMVCNITNPKMFVFYLALLPQFVGATAPVMHWLMLALMVPAFGTLWLIGMALAVNQARNLLLRRTVRRAIDGASGLLLVAFGLRLARET
ncbi:LysE family translocator [Limimaricola litoreus]